MEEKTIANQKVKLTEEGYLVNPAEWNKEIAIEIAKEEGIELSDLHFEVLEFLRKTHESGNTLTIRKVGKSGIVDIKGLYKLFPGGPLKFSSKIAGIPKPSSCV